MSRKKSAEKIRIIAAHAGTGKSYLANAHPDKFIDLALMPYKYILPKNNECLEYESKKADLDLEINYDYPYNYIKAIKNAISETDLAIIIPSAWIVLYMLDKEEIPYMLCYPENTEESREEYKRRYESRGNSDVFLEIFIGGWSMFMKWLEEKECSRRIIMKPHEFLSDVVEKYFLSC